MPISNTIGVKVAEKFVLVEHGFCGQIFEAWSNGHNHSLDYIRLVLRSLILQDRYQYRTKVYPPTPYPIPYRIVQYCLKVQSKAEIGILLWICERTLKGKAYCRFKVQDLSALLGVSRIKLSKALNSLIRKGLIYRYYQHVNFIKAHGGKYTLVKQNDVFRT